jgi:hypothetical protein
MMKPGAWRIGAGVTVLLLMILLATRLAPPYVRNLRFQNALTEVLRAAGSAASEETILKGVLEQAALLGLRVDPKDVRVRRAQGSLRVEVLYEVPVALPLYSVDLHFRPRARVP